MTVAKSGAPDRCITSFQEVLLDSIIEAKGVHEYSVSSCRYPGSTSTVSGFVENLEPVPQSEAAG